MRIIKTLLAAIGATFLFMTIIWFMAGYPGITQDRSDDRAAAQQSRTEPSSENQDPAVSCKPEHTFHLERLTENPSLKVVALGEQGIINVQRFLDLTLQTPIHLSKIPRLKVWVAWQNEVVSVAAPGGAVGVIDVVQDNCILYRREGYAGEIVAIANGEWSR